LRGGAKEYQAWHPCYTEPKTIAVAIARGWEEFERGELFYSLGINDGRRFQCHCRRCAGVGWPRSYYRFVSQVASGLRDDYPLQLVGVLAYGDVGVPPPDLKLPDNVLINVAGQRKDLWQGKTPHMGTYEYLYGAGFVIPNLPWEILQENFRYYREQDLTLYRAELYPLWAFDAPKVYVVRKLLWDPTADVNQLLREYCDKTFGAAGEPMYRFYLHAGSWRAEDVRSSAWTPVWGRVWPFRRPMQWERCPADYHDVLLAALADAKTCEISGTERARVEMVDAFTQLSANAYQMWRFKERVFSGEEQSGNGAQGPALLEAYEEIHRTMAGHPEWFLGSKMKFDSFDQREWPLESLRQQMRSAIVTQEVRVEQGELRRLVLPRRRGLQLVPLRRDEHPWYKTWQSRRMEIASRVPGGFQCSSQQNGVIQESSDDRHNGKQRFQWLHASARELPAGKRYLVCGQFEGGGGLAELTLQATLRDTRRRRVMLARSMIDFTKSSGSRRHELVVDLAEVDAAGDQPLVNQVFNLQWVLLWRADAADAELSGSATLVELGESADDVPRAGQADKE